MQINERLFDHSNPEDLLTKARTQLISKQPFWGELALYLKLVESTTIKTISTDGEHLFYSRAYVFYLMASGGMDLLQSVVLHEIIHIALMHIQRQKNRIHDVWNDAADYADNQMIVDAKLPISEGWLLDKSFVGMTADEIYEILLKDKKHKTKGENTDSHDLWQQVSSDAGKNESLSEAWKSRMAQALVSSEGRGTSSANIKQIVNQILDPDINWKQALYPYIVPSKGDYSFDQPDCRFMCATYKYMYVPTFISNELQDIVVCLDTSGSIDQDEQTNFVSHIFYILRSYPQLRGLLTSCDTEVQDFIELTHDTDVLTMPIVGGGGTDFVPVFDLIEEKGIKPSVLIYFTDGDGRYPEKQPEYPVLWVMSNKRWKDKIPFGKFIYYKSEEYD